MEANSNTYSKARRKGSDLVQLMRDINELEALDLVEVFDTTDLSIDNFSVVGDADFNGADARLTKQEQNKEGGVWFDCRVRVKERFKCTFQYRMNPLYPAATPADGLAFVLQNNAAGKLSGVGGTLGIKYANRLAVEFDSYTNSGMNDPSDNHVGVFLSSASEADADCDPDHNDSQCQLTQALTSPNLNDNTQREIVIEYDGTDLDVAFSSGSSPSIPSVSINLGGVLTLEDGALAYIGFNAACGSATQCHQAHVITDWKFEGATPPQTTWYAYNKNSTKTSLGTPDGGVAVPALNALDAATVERAPDHVLDIRAAVQALAPCFVNPSTGTPYNWTASDAENLYYKAMGNRTNYGATGGAAYDWTRNAATLDNETSRVTDMDIGELYECVALLKTAAGL